MMNNAENPQLTIPRVIGSLSFFNADNLEIMRGFNDNEFDLAVVDPPYGIDKDLFRSTGSKFQSLYSKNRFDVNAKPNPEYFAELFRVSKNQIIWGGNYYSDILPITANWFVWDKEMPTGITFRDFEMAWTSLRCQIIRIRHYGGVHADGNKTKNIHPTQKPVKLYDFIFKNFANTGYKILDTHLGSGSIAIAIEKANRLDKMNLQFVGIEIDKEYFEKAINRIEQYCRQGTLSF